MWLGGQTCPVALITLAGTVRGRLMLSSWQTDGETRARVATTTMNIFAIFFLLQYVWFLRQQVASLWQHKLHLPALYSPTSFQTSEQWQTINIFVLNLSRWPKLAAAITVQHILHTRAEKLKLSWTDTWVSTCSRHDTSCTFYINQLHSRQVNNNKPSINISVMAETEFNSVTQMAHSNNSATHPTHWGWKGNPLHRQPPNALALHFHYLSWSLRLFGLGVNYYMYRKSIKAAVSYRDFSSILRSKFACRL